MDTGERTGTGDDRAAGEEVLPADPPAATAPRSASRCRQHPTTDCLALEDARLLVENFFIVDFFFLLVGLVAAVAEEGGTSTIDPAPRFSVVEVFRRGLAFACFSFLRVFYLCVCVIQGPEMEFLMQLLHIFICSLL